MAQRRAGHHLPGPPEPGQCRSAAQGEIESTNPCGEQPLLPYESCNLGSINLVKMLAKTPEGYAVDYDKLRDTVRQAVHFLDNVIDVNNYPLEEIERDDRAHPQNRPGYHGLCGYAAVSGDALQFRRGALRWRRSLKTFINAGGTRPAGAGGQRGAFPACLPRASQDGDPLRNGTVTTIAPTGTLSMHRWLHLRSRACVCPGLCPQRHGHDGDARGEPGARGGSPGRGILFSAGLCGISPNKATVRGIDGIPEDIRALFVSAHDVSPEYHIRMQAAFQRYMDNAVSKTVNFQP